MAKIMQNLVVLMSETYFSYDISFKAGKMCFNRFCIDEDAAFELSGVWFLKDCDFYYPSEEDEIG